MPPNRPTRNSSYPIRAQRNLPRPPAIIPQSAIGHRPSTIRRNRPLRPVIPTTTTFWPNRLKGAHRISLTISAVQNAHFPLVCGPGPILERDLAQRAGIGFVKHTNLISRGWATVFIAEIRPRSNSDPTPGKNRCGSCSR